MIYNNYGDSNSYPNQPVQPGANQTGRGGCFGITILIVTFIVLVFFWFLFSSIGRTETTVSTVNRDPLPAGICIESPLWYEDHVDWIGSEAKLTKGMKEFYRETGVQPYLIITDNVNGIGGDLSDAEAEQYLIEQYDSLFTDKGHLILLFMEYADSEYKQYIYAGNQASAVVDGEAREIIFDLVDYYYTSDLNEDEYFSTVFEKSAERIMRKTTTANDVASKILVAIGILAIVIVINIFSVKKKQAEAKKAEEQRKILETPIDKIDDDPIRNKYK